MKISFHFVWFGCFQQLEREGEIVWGWGMETCLVCSCSVSRVEFISKVAKRKDTDRDADRK